MTQHDLRMEGLQLVLLKTGEFSANALVFRQGESVL